MQPLIAELLVRLRSITNPEPTNTDVLAAAEIFRRARKEVFESDLFPEINELSFAQEEVEVLRGALLDLLKRNVGDPNCAQIIWALSILRDSQLRSVFLEQLRCGFANLGKHKFLIDQALLGLEELEGRQPAALQTDLGRQIAESVDEALAWLSQSDGERPDGDRSQQPTK